MTGELITLPIRWGVRATSLVLRGGEGLASRGLALAVQAAGLVRGTEPEAWAEPEASPEPEAWAEPQTPATPVPAEPTSLGPLPDRGPAIDLDAPDIAAPEHVSEEPALAAEVAEPGAESGAGAEVHVQEPWPGYGQLNARDVVERISVSDPAQLAAIQLFESAHQGRQTVLSAVQRALALAGRSN